MCILSGRIKDIAKTNLFVSDLGRGVHSTIYSMTIRTAIDVAMILPVPVLRGSGEDAVRFVDLSGYQTLFDDMNALWPEPVAFSVYDPLSRRIAMKSTLVVHNVGRFVASYVPTWEDFHRLDECFRLDPTVWLSLPAYGNFGFAVFQFKANANNQDIHPMAYTYLTEQPDELFFPTVHVHDGHHAGKTARFDHTLFFQESVNFPHTTIWESSNVATNHTVNLDRTRGLVTGQPLYRTKIHGIRHNADQVLVARGGTIVHEMRGAKSA